MSADGQGSHGQTTLPAGQDETSPSAFSVLEQIKAMPVASTVTMQDRTGHFLPLLRRLGCSLAISTDESRLFLLGVGDKANLAATLVPKLCGVAVQGQFLAVAGFNAVTIFKNTPALAPVAPYAPKIYDAVYVPRAVHYTGRCHLHDLAFVGGAVTAVNTRYSCICTVDGRNSFTPIWKPPFITELRPEDRCHLNGMAIEDNRLRYVTMLGRSNEIGGWRNIFAPAGGIIMDTEGRTIADNLSLPHSPRIINGKLLLLESGSGQLLKIDPATGHKQILATLPGFTHGLVLYGGVLFIGLSKLRHRRTERLLPLEEQGDDLIAGIVALNAKTFEIIATLQFTAGAHEIFDLQLIPNTSSPDIKNIEEFDQHYAIEMPQEAFWASEQNPKKVNREV